MSGDRQPMVEVEGLGICYELAQRAMLDRRGRPHTGRGRMLLRTFLDATFARTPPKVHWALRGVDLRCHEGEAVGIVGPNGAGKSTLCLAVSRILEPDEGSVRVRGEISTLLSLGRGFNRDLTGRANIRLYGAFLGIPRRELEERMEEIIDFTELGAMIDEPIGHYSTGMRARLGFAVATTLEPEILLLDEILGVGDHAFRRKSQAKIREMMEHSKLILIVSHSLEMLMEMCTHCLWLDAGRVQMYGEAPDVLESYRCSLSD